MLAACNVHCGPVSQARTALAVVSMFMRLILVASVALFAHVVHIYPTHFKHRDFRVAVRFLLIRYRPGWAWWSIASLLRGFWLTVSTVIFANPVGQILWLVLGIVFYAVSVASVRPWRFANASDFDAIAHIAAAVVLASMAFLVEADNTPKAQVGILIIGASVFVTAVFSSFIHLRYRAYANQDGAMEKVWEEDAADKTEVMEKVAGQPGNFASSWRT